MLTLLAVAMVGLLLAPGQAVLAATINVNTTTDELNVDGNCSLREAIQAANTDTAVDSCTVGSGADTIILPAGTYTLTVPPAGYDDNSTGDLNIFSDLTITGSGSIIQACDSSGGPCTGIDRVLSVVQDEDTHVTVDVSGVTIRNGSSSFGGGIYNSGSLTLADSIVSGNSAGSGGGIANNGRMLISNSTVSGNTGGPAFGGAGGLVSDNLGSLTLIDSNVTGNTGYIGGIFVDEGEASLTNSSVSGNTGSATGGILNDFAGLTLTNTTVSGNTGGNLAGGIFNNAGTVTLTNSTVSRNTSGADGSGGIFNQGSAVTLTNSTVSGNTGGSTLRGAGGIFNRDFTLTLRNTTVSNNSSVSGHGANGGISNTGFATLKNTIVASTPPNVNCAGAITSLGHNLSSDNSCALSGPGDLNTTDPMLGPLADNGGPTETHALLTSSPAIDAGSGDCPPPATDQRGVERPRDGEGNGSFVCDIGAFEAPGPLPEPVGGLGLDPALPGMDAHGVGAHGHAPLQWALTIALMVAVAAAGLRLAGRKRAR